MQRWESESTRIAVQLKTATQAGSEGTGEDYRGMRV